MSHLSLKFLQKLTVINCEQWSHLDSVINRKLADNPYKSKYIDNRRTVIGPCVFMKQHMNVSELVKQIHQSQCDYLSIFISHINNVMHDT